MSQLPHKFKDGLCTVCGYPEGTQFCCSNRIERCLKCGSHRIRVYDVCDPQNDWKKLYTALECQACWDKERERSIRESMAARPDLVTRYSKVKLRTDYYGTVAIKDIIKDDDDGQGT